MLAGYPAMHWLMSHADPTKAYLTHPTRREVYQTLAVQIYLIGKQQSGPSSSNPLRSAIENAKSKLEKETKKKGPSVQTLEVITHRFLIDHTHFDELSERFQLSLLCLGEVVVGDEKLFHFTGNSGHIVLCISKPARIGLWFYELAVFLDWDDLSFIVDMFMKQGKLKEEDPASMNAIVMRWAAVGKRYTTFPTPLLVFDSLYFDNTTRVKCREEDIHYAASAQADRVKHLTPLFNPPVEKPGSN